VPRKRSSMRRIREVLRLKHELRCSHREIARSLGIANSTVSDYARRAWAAGLSWPLPEGLDDAALEAALFPGIVQSRIRPPPPASWSQSDHVIEIYGHVTVIQEKWIQKEDERWKSGERGEFRLMFGWHCGFFPHIIADSPPFNPLWGAVAFTRNAVAGLRGDSCPTHSSVP